MTSSYYNSSKFFNNNSAYGGYKRQFDHNLMLFNESEEFKDILSKVSLENWEQIACSLIFLRSQEFMISILKLCNEGNLEDARIITRSLFEHYIHLKYIKKKKHGRKFIAFYWIGIKAFLDDYENKYPDNFTNTIEFKSFKDTALKNYEDIKINYAYRGHKLLKWINILLRRYNIRRNWSSVRLSIMAKKVKDKKIHDFVMKNYSANVHCDIFGMSRFIKEFDEKIIFDNSPKSENMDDILGLSAEFFGGIVAHLAELYKTDIPIEFRQYLVNTDDKIRLPINNTSVS
jgi:hypothetical protein